MTTSRLVVVTTHPIQNHVPFFRGLAGSNVIDLEVLFALLPSADEQGVGFDVAFEWDVPLLEGFPWRELERTRRGPSPLARWRGLSASGLTSQLRDARPDAVLVTGWNSRVLVQAALAARRIRVPVLVRGDSNDLRRRRLVARLAQSLLFRLYSAFLVVGEANRRFYRSAGVAAHRMFFVPHCVDNQRFVDQSQALRPDRTSIRRQYGLHEDRFCFLFAGKLEGKKRVRDLLEATARAEAEVPGLLQVLIVGSGEQEEELQAFAREADLCAFFAGFHNQSEIPRAYAAADTLVLPSDAGETWGLVVNEAMASGLPAIVSDRVGCRDDLVRDGSTGYSFPCGDRGELAERMIRLAHSPEKAAEMGSEARRLVLERYSISEAVAGTVDALTFLSRGEVGS